MEANLTDFEYNDKNDILVLKGEGVCEHVLSCSDTSFEIDAIGCIIKIEMRKASQRLCMLREELKEAAGFDVKVELLTNGTLHVNVAPKIKTEISKGLYPKTNVLDKYVEPWAKLR